MPLSKRVFKLMGLMVFFLTIGAVIGAITSPGQDGWYEGLLKSTLNPPGWVFGVVWPILYVLIAVSAWLLLGAQNRPRYKTARTLFALQMMVNWGWSFVFFTLHLKFLSLIWIMLLVVLVAFTMRAMWPCTRSGALLLAPYLAWISFASYLAGTIWWLN